MFWRMVFFLRSRMAEMSILVLLSLDTLVGLYLDMLKKVIPDLGSYLIKEFVKCS